MKTTTMAKMIRGYINNSYDYEKAINLLHRLAEKGAIGTIYPYTEVGFNSYCLDESLTPTQIAEVAHELDIEGADSFPIYLFDDKMSYITKVDDEPKLVGDCYDILDVLEYVDDDTLISTFFEEYDEIDDMDSIIETILDVIAPTDYNYYYPNDEEYELFEKEFDFHGDWLKQYDEIVIKHKVESILG